VIGKELIGNSSEKRSRSCFAVDINSGRRSSNGVDGGKVLGSAANTINDPVTVI
jgi:hypothetical protein